MLKRDLLWGSRGVHSEKDEQLEGVGLSLEIYQAHPDDVGKDIPSRAEILLRMEAVIT